MKAMCEGLKKVTELKKLNMQHSIRSNKQAIMFASCLQFIPGLVELNIGGMTTDNAGMRAVCDGVKNLTKLVKLSMQDCISSNRQAILFASCLQFIPGLVELNISGMEALGEVG